MTEHRSRHHGDARARIEASPTEVSPARWSRPQSPTLSWEMLDPATEGRFSRRTLRFERLSRFDENNGDRESPKDCYIT